LEGLEWDDCKLDLLKSGRGYEFSSTGARWHFMAASYKEGNEISAP
jgi:hypothetical protein